LIILFVLTLQTSLKALSGAVSYINDVDHVSLLQSVSWSCLDLLFSNSCVIGFFFLISSSLARFLE